MVNILLDMDKNINDTVTGLAKLTPKRDSQNNDNDNDTLI